MIAPARRMASVEPHLFARLNQRKAKLRAAGVDVIALDMGSPDLPPSKPIIEALVRSARNPNHHGYSDFTGTPAVRRAFAEFYARRFGVALDPDTEVLLLIGSKEGIYHLSFAYLNPGDVALIPDPGYPTYAAAAQLAGATPHFMPLRPSSQEGGERWLPDLDAISRDALRKAKLLWLNYPNNPTASVAPLTFFEQALAFCKRHNILLVHDNPYNETGYDGYRAPSVLQVRGAKEIAVEFFSLSKSHNMAGMRVGALVGNAEVVKTVAALKSNVDTGSFVAIQDAAVEALTGDQAWLAERQAIYRQRRDVCIPALREAGCEVEMPRATIYVWARIPPHAQSSAAWAEALLEQAGVSVTPGTAFGQHGEGYFRISLTAPVERLREAMERIVAYERYAARDDLTPIENSHAVLA